MPLTKPLKELIAHNESLKKLSDRMIHRERKSSETLRRYLEGVLSFQKFMESETVDLALGKLREKTDITEILDQYVDWLDSRKFSTVNIKAHWYGVKKWLICNRVNNVDWKYISRPKVVSQIKDRIPTRDELRIILSNKISLRDKAYFMVAVSSGLRIGTISNLKVKDYQAIENLGMITVEGGPNKKLPEGKSYFTFITPETRKVLEDYLATRQPLEPDQPLFVKDNGEPLSPFVTNITRQWRRLIKRANLGRKIENHAYTELHAHVLRKYFQTNCKLAGCRVDFVDFWLGHHPQRQEEYLNDSYFRPSLQTHLEEYRKAIPSLEIFELTIAETTIGDLKKRLAEMEEWKKAIEKTISEKELIETQYKRLVVERYKESEKPQT
jgi:integrase